MRDEEQKPNIHLGILMIFAAWGLLLGMLTYFFHSWYTHKENPNREIVGKVLADGSHQVVLRGNYQHQYIATGTINGVPIQFLLDTGATDVVIPKNVADKASLPIIGKSKALTANGEISVSLTMIEEIKIGNIRLQNVKASINDVLDESYALLGMSALKQLRLEQSQNKLILTLPNEVRDPSP